MSQTGNNESPPNKAVPPNEAAPLLAYETVAVAGLGLIGGSLAMALRRCGYAGRILGVSSPPAIEEAGRLGIVDEGFGYADLPRVGERSDLLVLAGPISAILEHLRILGRAGDRLRRGLVVTDVGSTKRAILAASRGLPPHVQFIGGHPLAGSERRGIAAADPFLFQNAYYVLTPAPEVASAEVEKLARFLGSTGARMVVLPAEDHDRIAATISHLPQVLAVSLVGFLDDLGAHREHGVHLAAGGFRDMTRIASSPPAVWRDILATNKDVISDVARRFLDSMAKAIEELGGHGLEERFEKAARIRAEIPRDSKGFMSRLWDVLVVLEDRPGAICRIAAPLAERQINIKDIEILKVREGEGGTLRLAFESEAQAREAVDLLARLGHSARLRE